tara:strand:- start:376 stop:1083 length:708 start_codon:yes stop_codon:yes gene_type:complete
MKKPVLVLLVVFTAFGFFGNQQVNAQSLKGLLSQGQIGEGLKEALDHGIKNQVSKLTAKDGFFKNELVKILLPKELQKVDKRLRSMGLGNLADKGLLLLNRAAEDAVKTATPIFVNAVKGITFKDAKNILLGEQDAATSYLKSGTSESLYKKFTPVIEKSFSKVGADKIWGQLITRYNKLPFVKKVNPNLTDYVTNETLKGVFTMIAVEEQGIRKKIGLRDTSLLKKVFALQDKF